MCVEPVGTWQYTTMLFSNFFSSADPFLGLSSLSLVLFDAVKQVGMLLQQTDQTQMAGLCEIGR